jgi:hypothetical protein
VNRPFSQKFPHLRGDDAGRLVSAMAPLDEGGFAPVVFRAGRIDMIVGLNENLSALRLDDGVTIPVALPLSALKAQVFSTDFRNSGDIDLMEVTGEVAAEARKVTLSRRFNPAAADAGADAAAAGKGLHIVAFGHKEKLDRKFQMLRFNTVDMAYFEPHVERPASETFIKLKDGCNAGGFESFYIQIPMQNFMWHLETAKKTGRAGVDLTEMTRPRDAKGFEL